MRDFVVRLSLALLGLAGYMALWRIAYLVAVALEADCPPP